MGRWDWDGYERTRPLPADGIRAKTQKGKFGKTWWAGRWLAALERVMDSGRLSRGRSYARSGQVLKLDVSPGGVSARVQGSRQTPYKVSIRFQALADEEWEGVVDAIAEKAIYAARLLAGEMPEDIEELFEAAGVSLFPRTAKDLETECSCPDWANPCKHIAAVYYLLGECFDADPFLIFALRGRTKEAIVDALRSRRSQVSGEEEPGLPESADLQEEPSRPLSALLDRFWSAPEGIPELDVDFNAPEVDALAVKRLGPPPFWRGKQDFAGLMERAYRLIADEALDIALTKKRTIDD